MSLCCNSHQDFEKEIPYLFPELYFRDQFGVLLFHLGIIKESIKVSSVYALPLFEEQDLDGIGTVYRCVFMAGELTVLIENFRYGRPYPGKGLCTAPSGRQREYHYDYADE